MGHIMLMYERDDLCGVWRAKRPGDRYYRPCEDGNTVALMRWAVPLARSLLMSRYEGGLIRSVVMTAHTDQDGGLVEHLSGTMRVTPSGSAVRDVMIRCEVWRNDRARSRAWVTGVPFDGTAKRRRLKSYMVGWAPVVDDMGEVDE